MKKILNTWFLFLILILVIGSCKRTLPDYGATATVKMSNGWWVNYYVGGVAQLGSPVFYSTYNTAANTTDSMWIDDLGNFWNFKGTVAVDYKNLTFSSPLSINTYYSDTAKVANGKIFPKGGHSKTGVPTDSIYLEIQFSDDASPYGTTYVIQGTARTGIINDDY